MWKSKIFFIDDYDTDILSEEIAKFLNLRGATSWQKVSETMGVDGELSDIEIIYQVN